MDWPGRVVAEGSQTGDSPPVVAVVGVGSEGGALGSTRGLVQVVSIVREL